MQQFLKILMAGAIALAAMVLALDVQPDQQAIEIDHGQQQKQVDPEPAPPLPKPPVDDETNAVAMNRSKKSGRPLVIFLTADSCRACLDVKKRDLDAMRQVGELGIVDYDRDRATYDHYDVYGLVPVVLVYAYMGGDRWQNVGRYVGSDQIEAWLRPGTAAEATSLKDAGRSEAADEPSLLVLHDGTARCRAMFPVLARVRAVGYRVVYADAADPRNAKYLTRFKIQRTPYMVMYRGHEATEVLEGEVPEQQIVEWFQATRRGKLSGYTKSDSQPELKAADKVYLRRVLSPGSCGMLGCMTHGGGVVLEKVDAQGNPVSEVPAGATVEQAADVAAGPVRPWPNGQYIPGSNVVPQQRGTCPTGGCPSGVCPGGNCGGRRR